MTTFCSRLQLQYWRLLLLQGGHCPGRWQRWLHLCLPQDKTELHCKTRTIFVTFSNNPRVHSPSARTASSYPGNAWNEAATCHTDKRFASAVRMVDTVRDDRVACSHGRTWVAATCHRFHHMNAEQGRVAVVDCTPCRRNIHTKWAYLPAGNPCDTVGNTSVVSSDAWVAQIRPDDYNVPDCLRSVAAPPLPSSALRCRWPSVVCNLDGRSSSRTCMTISTPHDVCCQCI